MVLDQHPTEWALEQARQRYRAWHDPERNNRCVADVLMCFALYIDEHEQPPVDPMLATAREAIALTYSDEGAREAIRRGSMDHDPLVCGALAGLRLASKTGVVLINEENDK